MARAIGKITLMPNTLASGNVMYLMEFVNTQRIKGNISKVSGKMVTKMAT